MATHIRRVEYYNTHIEDRPGEAYKLLAQFAELGLNLLAFTAFPVGPNSTQLTIFPDDSARLRAEAERAGLTLLGPPSAFLVQGDDGVGVLAGILEKLYESNVNVYASSAVAAGKGNFGYILYVRQEKYETAAEALGV